METQISTAAQNSSLISDSNKKKDSVAQNIEVVSEQQRKTHSLPAERGKQKTGSPARTHNLRRRQAIDYSTAMGPNNKKQRSPHKKKLDDSTGMRL